MMRFFDQLAEPQVRALAWSCFSQPLINHLSLGEGKSVEVPYFPLTEQRRDWLLKLNADPTPLHRYLAEHCHSRRLGLVFEALWHFFLEQDQHTELLLHNLPIRDGGRTLGEFDVIYRSLSDDRVYHLELAVKFYLAGPTPVLPGEPLSQWLGPNVRDRLDLKLQRLREHQLPLAEKRLARAVLKRRGIDAVSPQLLVKGWLFQPWAGAITLPESINPDHAHGRWLPVSQFTPQIQRDFKQWFWLEKPQWLDGHRGARQLEERCLLQAQTRPQMLLACNEQSEETLRLFITPDDWPQC